MFVGRTDPNVFDARVTDARGGPAFTLGQHLTGRVVAQTGDGQFVLAFGDRRVAAQSALPLAVGQPIDVEVTRTGTTIQLRMLAHPTPPRPRLVEQQVALAAVLVGLRSMPTPEAPGGEMLTQAAATLQARAGTALPPDEAQALVRQLVPLTVGTDTKAVADALRAMVESGGLLFEARARQLLLAQPDLSDAQVLALLRYDLKSLLGRLAKQTGATPDAADQDAPTAHAGAGAAAAGGDEAAAALVGGRTLTRQLTTAAHWLADGSLSFQCAAGMPDGTASVRVRMRYEDDGGDEGGTGGRACTVVVRVDGETLGAVEARARWAGGSVRTTFTVEHEAARAALDSELGWYASSMRDGFQQVVADVCVDPLHLRRSAVEPVPELPDRALIDRRA